MANGNAGRAEGQGEKERLESGDDWMRRGRDKESDEAMGETASEWCLMMWRDCLRRASKGVNHGEQVEDEEVVGSNAEKAKWNGVKRQMNGDDGTKQRRGKEQEQVVEGTRDEWSLETWRNCLQKANNGTPYGRQTDEKNDGNEGQGAARKDGKRLTPDSGEAQAGGNSFRWGGTVKDGEENSKEAVQEWLEERMREWRDRCSGLVIGPCDY